MTEKEPRDPYTAPSSVVDDGAHERSLTRRTLRMSGLFLLGFAAFLVYLYLTDIGAAYWPRVGAMWLLMFPAIAPRLRDRYRLHDATMHPLTGLAFGGVGTLMAAMWAVSGLDFMLRVSPLP